MYFNTYFVLNILLLALFYNLILNINKVVVFYTRNMTNIILSAYNR